MVKKSVILAHFRNNDSHIAALIETIPLEEIIPRKPDEFFVSLCREIIGQQLSGRVADIIYGRFEKLFSRKSVQPGALLSVSDAILRATGMSWSKVRFIKDLSRKVDAKEVDLLKLSGRDDAGVIAELVKIHGIGPWTAEMFLIFTLGRPDVFSYGDLGLRRGIQMLYRMKKEPSLAVMKRLTKRWQPYRSYAARLLWRYKDGALPL